MQRTRSLIHNQRDRLLPLLLAYRNLLNSIVEDIWSTIEWKQVPVEYKPQQSSVPMNQTRLFPRFPSNRAFKRLLRSKHKAQWEYASHWVDSAEDAAFAILRSWKKNYNNGDRHRKCPGVTRLFARVKQSLCKLEGDRIRITLRPGEFVWIDLSKRYFRLPRELSPSGLGEPIIAVDMIHLPIHYEDDGSNVATKLIAWDSNFESLDGYSNENGWVKIDTKPLSSVHDNSSAKLNSVKRKFGRSVKGRRLRKKYRHRELHRAKKHQIEIARVMKGSSQRVVVEALRKRKMLRGRALNYRLWKTDWRGIATLAGERVEEVSPRLTSKNCSRCGWTNKDLNGAKVFECKRCGLRLDRQLNSCIGIFERAEGVPYDKDWWDLNILPSLVGGYFQSGAEPKAVDELVRSLYEAVKPQVRYGYDRFADAYLPVPPQPEPV